MTVSPQASLVLGRGDIRIDTFSDWENDTTSVLDSNNSLGQAEECVINNELEFRTKRNVDNISDIKKILTKNNLFLDATLLYATKENLNLLFTGNNSDPSGEFYFGMEDIFESLYRLEIKFLYPNKTDYMILILPKVKVISTSDLNLVSLSEPNKPAFRFQSFPVDNTDWNKKLGKVEFG